MMVDARNDRTGKRLSPKVIGSAVSLTLALALFGPPPASSQCIPNASVVNTTGAVAVTRSRAAALAPTVSFLAGCVGDPGAGVVTMGAGIAGCSFMATPPRVTIMLTAPSQNNPTQGCQWTCGTQTCRVLAGNALPVELMEFSVDSGEG